MDKKNYEQTWIFFHKQNKILNSFIFLLKFLLFFLYWISLLIHQFNVVYYHVSKKKVHVVHHMFVFYLIFLIQNSAFYI